MAVTHSAKHLALTKYSTNINKELVTAPSKAFGFPIRMVYVRNPTQQGPLSRRDGALPCTQVLGTFPAERLVS